MTEQRGDEITQDQDRTLLKVLPIAMLVGLGLTVGGSYLARFHLDMALNGQAATGRVVALEPGTATSASGQATFFPVVVFETPDGMEVTFRHRTGQRPPAYEVGEEVPVTFLAEAPQRALIAEGSKNLLLPGILIVIGSGLVLLSLLGIRGARRRLAR